MKIFYVLTIFISLLVAGVGCFLVVDAVLDGTQSYFSVARMILGGILASVGIFLILAVTAVALSDKVKKHRMKKRGGKK